MKIPPQDSHVERRFAATALMLGNFITGTSILAPAGMLGELSEGLQVSIREAGLLIAFGAIVLCIGSPLRLARILRQHWRCCLLQLPASGLASARRTDRRTGRPQDVCRSRTKPADRSAAVDHDLAGLGTVRRFHLSCPVADAADPGG